MKLFPPQEQIINSGILDSNEHCFLNLATGSGKTYLSEIVIEKVLQSGFKAVYVTPLRALAAQQQERWTKRFQGYQIGVFTGETIQKSSAKASYSKSQILIMTPERLDACMRNWRTHWTWIPDVSLVVIDEYHIMSQPQRGARLEGTITRLIRLNPFVRIFGLSATMPNAAELSDWLKGASFSSKWRQVPLEKKVVRFKSAKEKPDLVLQEVRRCIAEGGQSLIFCNSRNRVQTLAEFLRAHGISADCHHAGLGQEQRKLVEDSFKNRETKVLVATSTLEMGLNLPARQVVIYDPYSFTGSQFAPLPVWSFIQRAGRAGRPGLDPAGEVVLFLSRWSGRPDKYMNERCEAVDSQLTDSWAMQEQILIDVYSGFSRTREELNSGFLPLTFYKYQHEEASIQSAINKLLFAELLTEREEEGTSSEPILKVDLLGRMAVKLMFAPETVMLVRDSRQAFEDLYFFDFLFLAALSPDCSPVLPASYEELDDLCALVRKQPSVILDHSMTELKKKLKDCPETLRILAAIKMAGICVCLIQDEEPESIAQRFNVYESDVRMLKENVLRVLTGISVILSALDQRELGEDAAKERKKQSNSLVGKCAALTNMLQYQITSELVMLTQLDGVGGRTAKRLAAGGYPDLASIAAADPEHLAALKGIGKKLAEIIIPQAAALQAEAREAYTESELRMETSVQTKKLPVDPYRLRRSLELRIKGRDGGKYIVFGGREEHVVVWGGGAFRCDCMDYAKNQGCCKHILCVRHALGDPDITKMVKRIKEDSRHTIREALPSLWYAVTAKELEEG